MLARNLLVGIAADASETSVHSPVCLPLTLDHSRVESGWNLRQIWLVILVFRILMDVLWWRGKLLILRVLRSIGSGVLFEDEIENAELLL